MPGFNYGGNSVGDGTNWSSERGSDPTTPGGGDNGHAGDHSSSGSSSSTVEHTPWGDLTTDAAGYAYMNGIKLTADNSQLAYVSPTHLVRVLNSLLDRSYMKPEPGEHSGVTGVPATSPNRVTLADNALKNAQSKAQDAAAALSKANAAISQAQSVRGRCGLSITPSR